MGEFSDDTDHVDLTAGRLRRTLRGPAVAPEGLPLVAGLLTAALGARIDTLTWIDRLGPRLENMGPCWRVLSALRASIDLTYERPGMALDLIAAVTEHDGPDTGAGPPASSCCTDGTAVGDRGA